MASVIPTPLTVSFDKGLASSFKALLRATPLPTTSPIPGVAPWEAGIHLPWLAQLKRTLESDQWTVDDLERRINQWQNYTVRIKADDKEGDAGEEVDLHFVHVKSKKANAIPLLMCHGWPGTFWDFHKVIEPLTNPPDTQQAFHVVIPSLPGYFFSSQPQRHDWSYVDMARLFNRLMTQVLGYSQYAAQGGDWGSSILRVIGKLFPNQAPLLHFNMFRYTPIPGVDPTTFTELEQKGIARHGEVVKSGRGYFELQSTKPFTIGLALSASPLGLLAYIGEKFHEWSDPNTLDPADVLDTVALYYLSSSFATSVLIYYQSNKIRAEMAGPGESKWNIGSKIGFTLFPYEISIAPRACIAAVGPLVFYKERTIGGHFPALDNPEGLVEDLREFVGANWAM